MFPVVHSKTTTMCNAVLFLILSIEKQEHAIFFINRRGRYTHTNNYIYRDHILFDISFANNSETDSNV